VGSKYLSFEDYIDCRMMNLMVETLDFEEGNQFVPNQREVDGLEWVPLPVCIDMIFKQKIIDVFTITALLAYQYKKGDKK